MKRIGTMGLGVLLASAALASMAFAQTPNPTHASTKLRVFNDCPFSSANVVTNVYPATIAISDTGVSCFGFANMHIWSLSDDGIDETAFPNNSAFSLECDFALNGPTDGEGGLRLSPWYSTDADGLFNLKTTGEIACFGGRLPFYSFTAAYGINYVKGETVHLKIEYHQNGLSGLTPATIEYWVTIGPTTYDSGRLRFDQGNVSEDPPHGQWGCLNYAFVGGHYKAYASQGVVPSGLGATWSNIVYQNLDGQPVPTLKSSWGRVKAIYR